MILREAIDARTLVVGDGCWSFDGSAAIIVATPLDRPSPLRVAPRALEVISELWVQL
jgi:hypothetical protein